MNDVVLVEIPLSRDAAEILQGKENLARVGRLISEILRPSSEADDPAGGLIAELKADARAARLTDAEIDAELAAYNAEHRI